MFKNPFSFDGRIRRTEYGLSFIFYVIAALILNAIVSINSDAAIISVAYIPLLWLLWAQGAKRCHDVGNSGWWQIIPFYALWLLFQDGDAGRNKYGKNPKGIQAVGVQIPQGGQGYGGAGGYQGGYSGGHNNPTSDYSSNDNSSKTDGYRDGDLYR